ncbi:MAG: alpha-amylase [Flavobacteriales bacterium]|nr:MAG: alpha-amylase [Flavobacteriales bacterium]
MKKLLFLVLCPIYIWAQQQTVNYDFSPVAFEETESVTITIYGNSINEATWGVTDHSLYIWAWSYDTNDENAQDCPTNGSWTNSNEANKFTYNADTDTYTMTFVPQTFFNRTGIGKFGCLIKAKDGTGDKKSQDIYTEVGAFTVTMNSPTEPTVLLSTGDSFTISATNTNGSATYTLYVNSVLTTQSTETDGSFEYTLTNITENAYCTLETTQNNTTITNAFDLIIQPESIAENMPENLVDGINYNTTDTSQVTLVLTAPLKDFVYIAGSFNNWQPSSADLMKTDPDTGKFWLTLTGLTPGELYTYQYWVFETTPVSNAPELVKTADPFSTLVLSPFDDQYIPASSYPDLPAYPDGQEREVTVLQTGQTPYAWQVTDFEKPKKEDLIVYEVLIRDFDANRTFQNLIDRIDYFKNLNINAIELMPVMEFEGNESWGYNTAFHMALDKFYGPANKLKELIDVCHQNGIAVILDIAFNHAYGRNPMVRMWMTDPESDGWGNPSSVNPYFNQTATHAYSVGYDFNHSQDITKNYVKHVVKYWIEEFKIDGFRWDLTKGFTQNCTSNDEACTNAYQQDRVDILKDYADYSWSIDPDHYVIFEHLGTDTEEKEWANYRYNEGKGVMLWGKMTDPYNQLTMGYADNSNINRMGYHAHTGFSGHRVMGYAESHDEERLMYKNVMYGNAGNGYDIQELNTALSRMSALGAVSLTIPGPKMIWHFGDLGMDNSIFTCTDGSVNPDCKLSTKPQPQWVENWSQDPNRQAIYEDWSRINWLKINEPVFEGDYSINSGTLKPEIYISNDALSNDQLKDVVVFANFDVEAQTIDVDFPYTGTWYNLMNETSINVSSTPMAITLQAGEFRIFGNKLIGLGLDDDIETTGLVLYPNPANACFSVNKPIDRIQIFDMTGRELKVYKPNADNRYSIEDLSMGIYIVKLTKGQSTKTIKLIIQ